jgi:hypothetical protein
MYRFASFRRSAVALAVVAVLGFAGPVAAGEQVPFRGSLEGDVERTFIPGDPPRVFVQVEGSGHATQLGQFTFTAPHYVSPATRTAVGSYQFTAANGDTLTADFTGQATPVEGTTLLYIEETAVITGGTGRFAGATGSFVVERLYDTATDTTLGSFEGTISSPGS